jgi:hypothetical protein
VQLAIPHYNPLGLIMGGGVGRAYGPFGKQHRGVDYAITHPTKESILNVGVRLFVGEGSLQYGSMKFALFV